MELVDAGYRVFQVWGHEFAECERAVALRDVRAYCTGARERA